MASGGFGVTFTPDGEQVAVACGEEVEVVPFWDVRKGKLIRQLKVHFPVRAISFSSNGRWMAVCGSLPGRAEVWDLKSEKCVKSLSPNYSSFDDLAFVNKDREIALVGWTDERRPPLLVWEWAES